MKLPSARVEAYQLRQSCASLPDQLRYSPYTVLHRALPKTSGHESFFSFPRLFEGFFQRTISYDHLVSSWLLPRAGFGVQTKVSNQLTPGGSSFLGLDISVYKSDKIGAAVSKLLHNLRVSSVVISQLNEATGFS